jgi:hypothetical protein
LRKFGILAIVLSLIVSVFVFSPVYSSSPAVLFDNAHLQTAGNADWTITGGYSDFADAVRNLGYTVDQFGTDDPRDALSDSDPDITYDKLSGYALYIIPEPNDPFTSSEQQAILDYIENGGTVFFIADHAGADRNNNGYDAVDIFNEFVTTLGFKFTDDWLTEAPVGGTYDAPFLDGVSEIGAWGAGGIDVLSDNVKVAITYKNGTPFVVYGTYGKGAFVAIADSSPFDDGTGSSDDTLYDGWSTYDDAQFAINVVKYLVGFSGDSSSSSDNAEKVLLVDDDAGASYESYYEDALDSLGVTYDEVSVDYGETLYGINLSDYDLVIWITGQDYKYTLLPSDRSQIEDYIGDGGKVALFGPEVGYASYKYGWEDWLKDNFGADYVKGVSGTYLTISGDYVFDGLSAYVNAKYTWTNVFKPLSGYYIDIEDKYGSGLEITGKNTLLFGFGLEQVTYSSDRQEIIKDVLDYLLDD